MDTKEVIGRFEAERQGARYDGTPEHRQSPGCRVDGERTTVFR